MPHININFTSKEGNDVCIVDVEKGTKPIYFDEQEFFIRSSASSQPFKGADMNDHIKEHWIG